MAGQVDARPVTTVGRMFSLGVRGQSVIACLEAYQEISERTGDPDSACRTGSGDDMITAEEDNIFNVYTGTSIHIHKQYIKQFIHIIQENKHEQIK